LAPGNTTGPANHHVLPEIIKVKTGGVVNFVVAGFHQIFVYLPGTKPGDLVVPASGQLINDLNNLFLRGTARLRAPAGRFLQRSESGGIGVVLGTGHMPGHL
jgi:hypothetical protein